MVNSLSQDDYDVVMVSDLRFPGGTSASLAEEVKAQARAGYRTALVHVPGRLVAGRRALNEKLAGCIREGLADLVLAPRRIHARLLVMRHPAVFSEGGGYVPEIRAEAKVMIVNQAPSDASTSRPFYDVPQVAARIEKSFGPGTTWIPIGPLVRQALQRLHPELPLPEWDWTNVLDVDEWSVERPPLVGRLPVIGRHSRPSFRKWPADAADLLAAYPDDPNFVVKVLGGAEAVAGVLGRIPESWTVHGYDALPVLQFLAGIDFYVYFHHPGWIEAFGRAPLEALASGAVVIMPPHFRTLFREACLYGQPSDVQPLVTRLTADPSAYSEQAERGRAFVRDHFGLATHEERLARFIEAPSRKLGRRRVEITARARVLFVSSNGAGLGHLTRLMAMARRSSPDVLPVFFTLSQAVALVRQTGFMCEYLASTSYSHMHTRDWNSHFERRLEDIIETYRPRAVLFDGTWPYVGLGEAALRHPDIPFVWSRRSMWQAGRSDPSIISRGSAFRLVIEPGEFAGAFDRGLTTHYRDRVVQVPPITFLDRDELLSWEDARAELGLDTGRPAVLVGLGAGNINDIASTVDVVIERLSQRPEIQICVTDPLIAARRARVDSRVHLTSVFPLSRYLRAFDFAVSAAGYNSYHEFVAFGVPAVFVPNTSTSLDDQAARARYAAHVGVGLAVECFTGRAFDEALQVMLEEGRRDAMRRRAEALHRGNGAAVAMRSVEALFIRGAPVDGSS